MSSIAFNQTGSVSRTKLMHSNRDILDNSSYEVLAGVADQTIEIYNLAIFSTGRGDFFLQYDSGVLLQGWLAPATPFTMHLGDYPIVVPAGQDLDLRSNDNLDDTYISIVYSQQ